MGRSGPRRIADGGGLDWTGPGWVRGISLLGEMAAAAARQCLLGFRRAAPPPLPLLSTRAPSPAPSRRRAHGLVRRPRAAAPAPPSRCPAQRARPRRGRAGPHRGGFHERGGILAVQAVAEEPAGGEGGPHLREAEPEANPHPGEPRYCLTVLNPLHFSIKNELRKQIFFA